MLLVQLTLLLGWNLDQVPFIRPRRGLALVNGRPATPKWVETPWDQQEDAKFRKIDARIRSLGSEPSTLRTELEEAYQRWLKDSQNPERLYEVSRMFAHCKWYDSVNMNSSVLAYKWSNVIIGWLLLRDDPRSALFAKEGYRALAGGQYSVKWGDLFRRLSKRFPADRDVLYAGVAEARQEREVMDWNTLKNHSDPTKGEQFENILFAYAGALRKTSNWRPWDDIVVSDIWLARFERTRRKADVERALKQFDLGYPHAPTPQFDPKTLRSHRNSLRRLIELVKK